MSIQISGVELFFLTKEFQLLIGAKVNKIYQTEKKETIFNIHVTGKGKRILRINVPNFIYLTEKKIPAPQNPPGFCMFLRKRLSNARIKSIEQIGLERILKIVFETKEEIYNCYIELFSKGNIIITDKNNKIIQPLERQYWKERKIKAHEMYELPEPKINALKIDLKEMVNFLDKTDKDKIVTFLAIDFGLGGKFSELICKAKDIDKNEKPKKEMADKLVDGISLLFSGKFKPFIETGNSENDKRLCWGSPEEEDKKYYDSLSRAFDDIIKDEVDKVSQDIKPEQSKKILKLKDIISNQKSHIKKLQSDIDKYNNIGEIVYSNYQEIEKIIRQLNEAKKIMSVSEIKKKINNPKIKQLNEKEKAIVLELD